ncbi:MAG: hypothetical protein TEF_03575 [Rhizobiales bacterium NRL2]|jgi:hypothetical protein|nr:MAG: hypothetical protein TEF_03575 [Rhizobiales bacterium NRL2]
MKRIIAVVALGAFLAACGSSQQDRGLSGAGIGAAAGTAVGAVTGLSLLQGALLGAAAGGLTGVLTDKDMLDLGDPVWASDDREANRSAVARVQAGLHKFGYDPGPVDGQNGAQTEAAIRNYQRDNGLLVDGRASVELARHIENRLG